MELLSELTAIVAPIYLIVAIGFGWVRSGRAFPTEAITDLVMLVGAPCLAFSRLSALEVSARDTVQMFGATAAAVAAFLVLGFLALRLARLPVRPYLGSLAFANTANMGLPVCLFAFGEPGLTLAVCYYAVVATAQFTLGVLLYSGGFSLRELARAPLPLVVVLALGVNATGAQVPLWLSNTTDLLGDLTIPLMQLSLGVSLAAIPLRGLRRSAALGALRIAMGLCVGVGLAEALDLQGVVRGVFILDCAMPAAVFNYLFARRYDQRPEEVAGIVLLSTLLAFVSLPAILAFVL